MPDMRIFVRAPATIKLPDGTTRDVVLELTPDQMVMLNNPEGKTYSMGCNIAKSKDTNKKDKKCTS